LSAIAQLSKGDIPEAVRALKRALSASGPATSGKQTLTAALILLEADRVLDATRSALEALANTRRIGEAKGEHAALLVLAGCYRRLGRAVEAEQMEAQAGA
jgi:tetratricopeptide (TPR) repeat protein